MANGMATNSFEKVLPGFCLKAVFLKGLLTKRNYVFETVTDSL